MVLRLLHFAILGLCLADEEVRKIQMLELSFQVKRLLKQFDVFVQGVSTWLF